jgi:hypothetical protein
MADKIRKPVPKNQREISISQQTPLLDNPNNAVVPLPIFANQNDPATAKNYRAEQISVKGDTSKDYTVGIGDIDETIAYYFNNVIKPQVYQNGTTIPVPIVYGNPERWKAVQKDGYYRDKNDKIMCPIIMFKRTSLDKSYVVGNKLDANNPNNYAIAGKAYQKGNTYSNFDLLNNRKPVTTYQAVVIPDYVTLNYECVIWTYYVEQMNSIVEGINYSSDSYWGDPSRFKFRARIDSFADNTTVNQGEERLIKTTFNIKMYGYIIPAVINKELVATKKFFSKGRVNFTTEVVGDINDVQ